MTTTSQEAMSIVRAMYDLIDRQEWADHAALISDDFRSILGSLAPVSFTEWQGRVKRIYDVFRTAGMPSTSIRLKAAGC